MEQFDRNYYKQNSTTYMRLLKFNKPVLLLMGSFLSGLFCQNARAQLSIGIDGGYNKNYLITNNANRAFTNYQPLSGFSIGVPVQYRVNNWFALATDLSVIQKNYSQVRSDFFAGVYEKSRNTYIQLPLMAYLMFGEGQLKGFVNTGVYGGYSVASRVRGVMPNILDVSSGETSGSSVYDYSNPYSYNEKYTFDKRKDNRFEAGWLAGLGVSYGINDRYEVFSEARLLYGFTDQQKNYEAGLVPRYNTTYGIHAGILVHLHMQNTVY